MNTTHTAKTLALLLMGIFLISAIGCTTLVKPLKSSKAETGYHSQVIDQLASLPPPREKVILTTYKFRDQSGQYKSSTGTVNYSTAITQGATSMLMKALEDAGRGLWFTVVERESLPNLLNERKIIRQTRLQYVAKEDLARIPQLPPMLYAPLLIEGGVIAYESNLLTGGLGAKYLGIGGQTEFQRDTVTVYLRMVSVQDGRVLKSVQTAKTIFSVKLDASIFKFVGFQQLMEGEVGFTSNEPPQMAVLEAIEQGVYSLIMEGVIDGLWSFQNPDKAKPLVDAYLDDKLVKPVPVYDEKGELTGFTKPTPAPKPAPTTPPAEPAPPPGG
jgi:curli production assembly/transport component CsgG